MVAPWNITQYQKARLPFLALTGGEQPVFVRDKKAYTRKDVVLSTANKDGGAHVDKPDANLQALQEGFWIRTVTHADGTKRTEPLADSHFRSCAASPKSYFRAKIYGDWPIDRELGGTTQVGW